jgi:predicted nucleic acid-binding protein
VALILDTGPLLAALNRRDPDHAVCRRLIEDVTERLVIPSPVLPELDYLVAERLGTGAMIAFLQDVSSGAYEVEDLGPPDYERIQQVMDTYSDNEVGFVDASVLAIAERLDERKVATLDHRHFAVLKPRHCDALQLLP